MTRTLFVTNDFPPRFGGIQTFIYELARRRPPGSVVVFASHWEGAAEFDAAQSFPIIRYRRSVMLPTFDVRRQAAQLLREHGCDSVVFGAAFPLALIAPALRGAGASRLIAVTHGHEAGLAGVPGGPLLLRRIGSGVDVLTYLGAYTKTRIASAVTPAAAARMARLTPGVDAEMFVPTADGAPIRQRYGLGGRPVVACVSRLMARKGQDELIRAWPAIRRRVPGAALLLVGSGPDRPRLERLIAHTGTTRDVILTGPVPYEELPAHYAACDVFAMPCRTRNRGLDVEGLGIVYLEASACGKPVVAGDSGGAPDAVLPGETGFVVGGRDQQALVDRISELLLDPELARTMGAHGRTWVEKSWRWERVAQRFDALLEP